jgi:hypothetical protein
MTATTLDETIAGIKVGLIAFTSHNPLGRGAMCAPFPLGN